MAITLNGSTGITTPSLTSDAGITADGISFADGTPSNTLVTTTGGNVGIGTSSPYGKLDAVGTVYVSSAASNPQQLALYANSTASYVTSTYQGSGSYKPLAFEVAGTERMRIDSSGRTIVGYSSSVGTAYQTNMQVKGGGTAATYAGYGLITSNNESAGLFGVYSNTENSLWIASDPDNLRSGSRTVFTVDGTEVASVAAGGNFAFNSGYGSSAVAYGCRAWVNFNGTGTVSIRASGNVSSITDLGTGFYRMNFTNAMPDANYSMQAWDNSYGIGWFDLPIQTTYFNFKRVNNSFNANDVEMCVVAVFR